MKLASGSAGHFSHWSVLGVMKQIQSESKMIPSSGIAERDSRDRREGREKLNVKRETSEDSECPEFRTTTFSLRPSDRAYLAHLASLALSCPPLTQNTELKTQNFPARPAFLACLARYAPLSYESPRLRGYLFVGIVGFSTFPYTAVVELIP